MKHFPKQKNKGFTLLFSMLVATLVVSISATVISIALRQTILSGTSRESQYAFYAANAALECAFYWDRTNRQDLNGKKVFIEPQMDPQFELNQGDPEDDIVTCDGVNIITGDGNEGRNWEPSGSGNELQTTFYLKIKRPDSITVPAYEYCAEAIVKKRYQDTNGNIKVFTTIETKGYNTCDENNPRRVERGLIQQYDA